MKFRFVISAVLAAVILSGCSDSEKPAVLERLEFSEFETVTEKQLEYLANNINPQDYITDYNYVDRGSYKDTPNGLYDMYFMTDEMDFEELCRQKNADIESYKEVVGGKETEKISETDIYAYYNTPVTTMELYRNADGTTEKKPYEDKYNFTLFLKNFKGGRDDCTYIGEMSAEAIKSNFDVYLYESIVYAREVTETADTFIYRYIDCKYHSAFWDSFYRFDLSTITIHKDSGRFSKEVISNRFT